MNIYVWINSWQKQAHQTNHKETYRYFYSTYHFLAVGSLVDLPESSVSDNFPQLDIPNLDILDEMLHHKVVREHTCGMDLELGGQADKSKIQSNATRAS